MSEALDRLLEYPLLNAIFGRRARRFGLGMRIPSGSLAFTSRHDPVPLSELERSLLLAVGTGVSGWSFGVPYGPDRSDQHGHYSVHFTGRTAPTGVCGARGVTTMHSADSLDRIGVRGAAEDPSDGFACGGWIWPYSDPEFGAVIREGMALPFDLLLGRRTFEIWADDWP